MRRMKDQVIKHTFIPKKLCPQSVVRSFSKPRMPTQSGKRSVLSNEKVRRSYRAIQEVDMCCNSLFAVRSVRSPETPPPKEILTDWMAKCQKMVR